MQRGSRLHAPMSAPARPTRTNRNAVLLRAVPKRRSLARASIAPAPAQTPSTAATMGCGQARIALTTSPVIRVNASSSGIDIFVSGSMISKTSPPEQKLSPAPVMTTARTSVARRRSPKRSRNSAYDSKVSGFLRSGRFRVIVPTLPATDQPTCMIGRPEGALSLIDNGLRGVSLEFCEQAIQLHTLRLCERREDLDDPRLMAVGHRGKRAPPGGGQ